MTPADRAYARTHLDFDETKRRHCTIEMRIRLIAARALKKTMTEIRVPSTFIVYCMQWRDHPLLRRAILMLVQLSIRMVQ
jgi:hypothetical protein